MARASFASAVSDKHQARREIRTILILFANATYVILSNTHCWKDGRGLPFGVSGSVDMDTMEPFPRNRSRGFLSKFPGTGSDLVSITHLAFGILSGGSCQFFQSTWRDLE